MTDRGLSEREQARAGPRALKQFGSAEWCWQTVDYFKDSLRHVEEQWRQAETVLEDLVKAKAWEVIPPEKPYGTINKMLKAETGLDRRAIEKLIREAQLPHHGEIGGGHTRGDNVTSGDRGNSETYIVRRLKRDRPDLAELVLSGKTSAHAAGIAAGFVRNYASVPIDDVSLLAGTLRRRLTAEQLAELKELL